MKKALLFLFTILALFAFISCDNSVDYPFDDDVPAVETPEMVPLTFEFIKDGKIIITNKPANMKFTRNSGAKQDVPENGEITAEGGDRIKLFATRTTEDDLNIICDIGDCYIYGNVMSLIKEEGFADKKDVFDYAFSNLFSGNTHIKSHSSKKLVLPATTLAKGCYNSMFEGCTGLTIAPDLPAEQLAQVCYFNMFAECSNLKTAPIISANELAVDCCSAMFRDCTSLTTAPVLLATVLKESCYSGMFEGCTSLASAPELKAETLVNHCYEKMLSGCSSLNYIKCLATNISATDCTKNWVEGVATEGLFEKADGVNWEYSNDGIPLNWCTDPKYIPLTLEFIQPGTITITNRPDSLKYTRNDSEKMTATDTIDVKAGDKIRFYADRTSRDNLNINCNADCYIYGNVMSLLDEIDFANENDLFEYAFYTLFDSNTRIKNHASKKLVLPATNLALGCYEEMFDGCTSLTMTPELPALIMKDFCYQDMFRGCKNLTSVPDLPSMNMAIRCYAGMFNGCKNLRTAQSILPATELKRGCYYYMFYECENLTTAPILPATVLKNNCYERMFYGCRKLNSVTCLATDLSESFCTERWLYYVSYNGTFTKAESMTSWPSNGSGIPSNWTVQDYVEP